MGRIGHLETIVILDTPRCSNMIPFDLYCRCKHVEQYSLNWDLLFFLLQWGISYFSYNGQNWAILSLWFQWGELVFWKLLLFSIIQDVPIWSLLTYVVDVSICNNIHSTGIFGFFSWSEDSHSYIIMARIEQFCTIGFKGESWSFGNYCYSRYSKLFQYDPFWLML